MSGDAAPVPDEPALYTLLVADARVDRAVNHLADASHLHTDIRLGVNAALQCHAPDTNRNLSALHVLEHSPALAAGLLAGLGEVLENLLGVLLGLQL